MMKTRPVVVFIHQMPLYIVIFLLLKVAVVVDGTLWPNRSVVIPFDYFFLYYYVIVIQARKLSRHIFVFSYQVLREVIVTLSPL